MNKETIQGIVGALVLVAAMVAVFQYERTIGAERAGIGDAGAWTQATLDGPVAEAVTPLGESSTVTLPLNATGLTNVTFTLSWTAGQGSDTLTLAVEPPTGVEAPEPVTDASGAITLTVPVANARPAGGEPGSAGVGNWIVTVTFDSASGLLPPPAPPVGGDGNVAWTLATRLTAWTPESA